MSQYAERRDAQRATHHIIVRYHVPGAEGWYVSPLRDLSRTGARFLFEGFVSVGDLLGLWIGPPMFTEPVKISARVVWHHTGYATRLPLMECGVQFEQLESGVRRVIENDVTSHLRTSRCSCRCSCRCCSRWRL